MCFKLYNFTRLKDRIKEYRDITFKFNVENIRYGASRSGNSTRAHTQDRVIQSVTRQLVSGLKRLVVSTEYIGERKQSSDASQYQYRSHVAQRSKKNIFIGKIFV